MPEHEGALRKAAAELLSARLVLEPDSDEVLSGKRYAPICPADLAVDSVRPARPRQGPGIRVFAGLTQSAQQSRRNEWSWRYEWLGFQWQTVRELLKRNARNGRRLAVIGVSAKFTATEQAVLLWVDAWKALPLFGVVLCEEVELRHARTSRPEAPFFLHLPPHTRRMRYWTETILDGPIPALKS